MATEITTGEVFERALAMSVDERAQLARQLLLSLEGTAEAERDSSERISARFKALDARFVVAVARELEHSGDIEEPFDGARLA